MEYVAKIVLEKISSNTLKNVTEAIQTTRGKNTQRILILVSPGKTAKESSKINSTIYQNDTYMMAKWHIYTSGSNKRDNLSVYWRGNGSSKCRTNVRNAIEKATNSTKETGLLTYFSACMAHDNLFGVTTESEAINFARFIITELQQVNISWSFYALEHYYDTKRANKREGLRTSKTKH